MQFHLRQPFRTLNHFNIFKSILYKLRRKDCKVNIAVRLSSSSCMCQIVISFQFEVLPVCTYHKFLHSFVISCLVSFLLQSIYKANYFFKSVKRKKLLLFWQIKKSLISAFTIVVDCYGKNIIDSE